mmetsp:Transcript_50011/g.124772  ORF Transcript_50011/g.124772 Transcript_50011/m.124772 type:complete len:244 (+) Transcript_50011:234-965(+)
MLLSQRGLLTSFLCLLTLLSSSIHHVLVHVPHTMACANTADLGHILSHALDGVNLLAQVLLDLVAELWVVALLTQHVERLELAIDKLLELKGQFHCIQSIRSTVHARELHLGNSHGLEHNLPAAGVLVLHELMGVPSLLLGLGIHKGSKALESNSVAVEVGKKRVVGVRGSVLDVDVVVESLLATHIPVDTAAALGIGGALLRLEDHATELCGLVESDLAEVNGVAGFTCHPKPEGGTPPAGG